MAFVLNIIMLYSCFILPHYRAKFLWLRENRFVFIKRLYVLFLLQWFYQNIVIRNVGL